MEQEELLEQVNWGQMQRLARKLLLLLATGDEVRITLLANDDAPVPTGLQEHIHQFFWEVRLFRPAAEAPIDRIVLIPPGVRHRLIQRLGETKIIHYRIGENLFETTWLYPGYGQLTTQPSQLRMLLHHLEMMRDYRRVYGEQAQEFLNAQTHFLGRALLSLSDNASHFTGKFESKAVRGDNTYVAALKYINAHYRAPTLTIAEVAHFIGICENGLSRIFRKHLGISARRYLVFFRLAEACNLLAQEKATAATVARRSGWHSTDYFLATFRKVIGMTVSAYVAQCQHGECRMPGVLLGPIEAAASEQE